MQTSASESAPSFWNLAFVLDLMVFLLNLVLVFFLSRILAELAYQAKLNTTAKLAMAISCSAAAFLQPVGGILKRRSAHQRVPGLELSEPWNWICNPFCYFLSQLVFLISVAGFSAELWDWISATPPNHSANYFGLPPWLFTLLFLGVPALATGNTYLAYFYFRTPKHRAWFKFLDSPKAESFGNACLFLNIILYQAFWAYLMSELPKDYSGLGSRLFTLLFTALLIYFPPRIFYLAEYGNRRLVWLMMLLANSPILIRVFFARSSDSW